MLRYIGIVLIVSLAAIALAGCAPRPRPMPPTNSDLRGALKLNQDAKAYLLAGDMPSAAKTLDLQQPLIIGGQKYTDGLWLDNEAKTERLNDLDTWWIGPRGWRWIKILSSFALLIYVAAGAFVVFGGPMGATLANALPLMNPFAWLRSKRATL